MFDAIAQASAKTMQSSVDPALVANAFLHPLNAHPNSLTRYEPLLDGKSSHKASLLSMASGLRAQFMAIAQPAPLFEGDPLPKQSDVLFISHFLRPSQAHDLIDLYFGTLPQWLEQGGVSSVTALINHARQPWSKLSAQWQRGTTSRLLLSISTDPGTERKIAQQVAEAARQLRRQRKNETIDWDRRFLGHAAASAGSSGSRTALRIGLQVQELVRRLKPKMLVTTYEGHSWERLAFHAARLVNPDIICVGYHHALLFPSTWAMTRRLGAAYDADHILTAGDNTTHWLRQQPGIGEIPTTTMGSVRAAGAARSPQMAESSRTCLVIPEGTALETSKLAELAAQAAQQCPNVAFRIRLHPVLGLERLLRGYPALRSLPSNVTWSSASLDEDLDSSRWALYRGTTAVIASVLAGLKPIYYHDGGIVIDPLNTLPAWRDTVDSATSLVRSIEVDLTNDATTRQTQFRLAEAYCRKCFGAFNPEALAALLAQGASR